MKKNHQPSCSIKLLFCLLFATVLSATGYGQTLYKLSASPDNTIKVLGKSNVHDWVMTAGSPVCEAEFVTAGTAVKALKSLTFSADAKNLKSEHPSMDDRAHKTMKADDFPKIVFKLVSAVVTPGEKDKTAIAATGTLTIAGVVKAITMQVIAEINTDATITCTGEGKIKLTDFKIDPPTFMLGAMKVKDDVIIQYTLNFKK